ncbi:MAG: hypothetical protein AAFX76_02720 [Planctomycetota bacterium]
MSPATRFGIVTLLVSLWVHASEVFRYFVIVMPTMRDELSEVVGVAPMNGRVMAVWAVWDTLLTAFVVGITRLFVGPWGHRWPTVVAAGSFAWLGFFLLFWIGMVNMGLSSVGLASVALPLAWIEMVVAAGLASWLWRRLRDASRAAPKEQPHA